MDADSLRRDIDFYIAGGGVAALLYNMNFQRTFFESRVWTPYWRDLSLADDGELLLRGRPIPSLPGQSLQTAESYKEMFQSVMRMRRNCPDYMRAKARLTDWLGGVVHFERKWGLRYFILKHLEAGRVVLEGGFPRWLPRAEWPENRCGHEEGAA